MIAVVVGFEQGHGALGVRAVFPSKFLYSLLEICGELGLCDAADCGIFAVERDVAEVVQTAEDGHLAEAADAGQHREADIPVEVLDVDVDGFEQQPVGFAPFHVVHRRDDGVVIFVDEDNHGSTVFLVCRPDDIIEPGWKICRFDRYTIFFFPNLELIVENIIQAGLFGRTVFGQTERKDSVWLPFCLQPFDCQSFE